MAVHGFSHLTARKKVRVTNSGGFKTPRGRPGRPRPKPDPSGGKGTIPPGGGGRKPPYKPRPRPMPKGPKPVPAKRKAAVDYVMERRKRKGAAVTRGQARKIVKRNIKADRKDRAYKYDFAGDGSYKDDEDYGTKANNRARKKHGYKPVKKNRKNHGGGDGTGPKGDKTTSADNAGNSQSGDSYGGPQSLSAGERLAADRAKKKKKKNRRRHSGAQG